MINEKKAGIILSYISIFLAVTISLFYTPYLIRSLGQEQYGLYSLINTVIVYFTVFDFGFGNAIIRYSAQYRAVGDKESQKKLNGMLLVLYIIIGIFVALFGVILALNTEFVFRGLTGEEASIMKVLTLIAVFNVSISFPFTVFRSLMQAYEKFILMRVLDIARHIINPIIIILILSLGYKAIGVVLATTIITIIMNLFRMVYCFVKLEIKFKIPLCRKEWKLLKGVSIYSFFVFLNIIFDRLFWNSGHIILGIVQSSIAIAIFGLSNQIIHYYMLFSTSMTSVFLPQISQIVAKEKENCMQKLSDLFIKTGRLQFYLMGLLLTGFIFFGRQFINLWAGEEYQLSYYVALIMMIPFTVDLIQNVGISILQGLNKHRFRSIAYLIIAVINTGISIPLAIRWGAIGSAVATAFSLIMGTIIIINIYYYKIGIDIKSFWMSIVKILPSLLIPISVGILLLRYIDTEQVLFLALSILIYTICYGISIWFFSMNKYEKGLILKPLNRMLLMIRGKKMDR